MDSSNAVIIRPTGTSVGGTQALIYNLGSSTESIRKRDLSVNYFSVVGDFEGSIKTVEELKDPQDVQECDVLRRSH